MMNKSVYLGSVLFLAVAIIGCGAGKTNQEPNAEQKASSAQTDMKNVYTEEEIAANGWATATFGGGCFWCTEAIFERIEGVKSVVSGYAGGRMENPTYQAVCTDTTGHAECVQIVFDTTKCSFATLLDVHMKTHDPTTPNRQGADVGIQYRSVVFYADAYQMSETLHYIKKLQESKYYSDPIVTEVVQLSKFWPAETYHQDYFANNPDQPYCVAVVAKKVDKAEHLFPELLKK